jgi:uncharacterized protein YeaO (DUF488 family)
MRGTRSRHSPDGFQLRNFDFFNMRTRRTPNGGSGANPTGRCCSGRPLSERRFINAMLKTKSIHSAIEPGDGLRILISRFRGRGIPRARCDLWMANLGPSEKLLREWKSGKLPWAVYIRRYKEELFHSPDLDARNNTIKNHGQKFTLRLIRKLAESQDVTLMCQCSEEEPHCHRFVLQKLILSCAV